MIDDARARPALLDPTANFGDAAARLARDHEPFDARFTQIDRFLSCDFGKPQGVSRGATQKPWPLREEKTEAFAAAEPTRGNRPEAKLHG
jgi:hypothetical protein